MSGPITAGYILVQGVLMLSAAALKEARALKCEYGAVLAQLRDRENAIAQARQGQRNARLERLAAVRGDAQRQAARLDRLRSLAQALTEQVPDLAAKVPAARPVEPDGDDDAAWAEHLRALEAAVRELETLLTQTGGAFGERVRASLAATGAVPVIDDVLGAYLLQRQMQPGLDTREAERFRATAARVLARLEMPAGAALPKALEALAKAIVLAPTLERAESLATELRLAVQRQRDAQVAQRGESAEAKRLLEELPDDTPAPLLRALECVAAGVERMDAALREAAEHTLATAAADRERREQEAATLVLQESLRDLGYEVDGIGETLFVDGGVVHFQPHGLERLLRAPAGRSARAHCQLQRRARDSGDEENAERSAWTCWPRNAGAPSSRGSWRRWPRAAWTST